MNQTYLGAISGFVPSPERYVNYLRLVFDGVPLRGQTVLDVGGGDGLLSFYAASESAQAVVCLDPAGDGSQVKINERYNGLAAAVGGPVTKVRERFQDHDPGEAKYDVLLVHNAINHLDEDACARLPAPDAAERYRTIFTTLRGLIKPGGHIIVADCGRRNLWGDLHLPNVFAPSIEWHIHQEPKVWNGLMVEAGFEMGRIRWDAPSKMRRPGQFLLGNRAGSYLTSSHFIINSSSRG